MTFLDGSIDKLALPFEARPAMHARPDRELPFAKVTAPARSDSRKEIVKGLVKELDAGLREVSAGKVPDDFVATWSSAETMRLIPAHARAELCAAVVSTRAIDASGKEKILGAVVASLEIESVTARGERYVFLSELARNGSKALAGTLAVKARDGIVAPSGLEALTAVLVDCAEWAPEGAVRDRFMNPSLPFRERLDVLRHATSVQREKFMEHVAALAATDRTVLAAFDRVMDNAVAHATVKEQAAYLKSWIGNADSEAHQALARSLLRASRSPDDLELLVRTVGYDTLWGSGDAHVREWVGAAELVKAMHAASFPARPAADASREKVLETLKSTIKTLEQFETAIDEGSYQANCRLGKEARAIARSTRRDLAELLAGESVLLDGALRDQVTVACVRAQIETKYGVHLTTGRAAGADPSITVRPWTLRELEDVEFSLSVIPRGALLFAPRLNEIQKVPDLGDRMVGLRLDSGKIQIAQSAIDNDVVQRVYGGQRSLRVVLVHEIGHGLQIGGGSGHIEYTLEGAGRFGDGELIYDFQSFLGLSRWHVIHRERYRDGSRDGTVLLDGKLHEVEKSIEHGGDHLFLRYQKLWNILVSHDPRSKFSASRYGRENPWEDWAESFMEYVLLPDRLIEHAPEKFVFMELEFRRYKDRPELLESARNPTPARVPAPPILDAEPRPWYY